MTLLSRMALEGASAAEIALALDRTTEAVRIKAAHQRIVLTTGGRHRSRIPPTPPATNSGAED